MVRPATESFNKAPKLKQIFGMAFAIRKVCSRRSRGGNDETPNSSFIFNSCDQINWSN